MIPLFSMTNRSNFTFLSKSIDLKLNLTHMIDRTDCVLLTNMADYLLIGRNILISHYSKNKPNYFIGNELSDSLNILWNIMVQLR